MPKQPTDAQRERLRSRAWFDNPANVDMTALYLERTMNYGLTLDELQSGWAIIGIAQTGSDLTPCTGTTSFSPPASATGFARRAGSRRVFEILGTAGIAISMLAYLPQVVHLAKERCSAGVSSRAWTMWLISSILIGALALHRHDAVFILLQVSSLTSAAVILLLGHRYRGMVCEAHMHSTPERWIGTGAAD